jgi:hypothetical protein
MDGCSEQGENVCPISQPQPGKRSSEAGEATYGALAAGQRGNTERRGLSLNAGLRRGEVEQRGAWGPLAPKYALAGLRRPCHKIHPRPKIAQASQNGCNSVN